MGDHASVRPPVASTSGRLGVNRLQQHPQAVNSLSCKPSDGEAMIKRCDSVTGNSSSIDAGYSEPLGPLQERPKTSRRLNESDYADVEIGDDLLPL